MRVSRWRVEGLEKEIAAMVSEAGARDAEEDARYGKEKRGDELPDGLRHRKERLRRLAECKAKLEAEKEAARRAQEAKIAQRNAEEAASGEKKRERHPKAPDQAAEEKVGAKANMTDPASEIMKTRRGYGQGCNAQAVVTEDQYIVAPGLTTEANDQRQLRPMPDEAAANLHAVGVTKKIGAGLADAGYCSNRNLTGPWGAGPELLVHTTKDWKRHKALREEAPPCGRIPKRLTGWSASCRRNAARHSTRNERKPSSRSLGKSRTVGVSIGSVGAGRAPARANGP